VTTIVKVAHLPFGFFKGACARGIYDNMKTAVETIFVGKDRQYNRRFLQAVGYSSLGDVIYAIEWSGGPGATFSAASRHQ
jgi:hypothetical protein